MWLNNLRQLIFRSRNNASAHRKPRRPCRQTRVRPQLEILEARLAPAGIGNGFHTNWDNNGDHGKGFAYPAGVVAPASIGMASTPTMTTTAGTSK